MQRQDSRTEETEAERLERVRGQIRGRHFERNDGEPGNEWRYCRFCGEGWPCDTALWIAEADRLREENEWLRESEKFAASLAAEADRLLRCRPRPLFNWPWSR